MSTLRRWWLAFVVIGVASAGLSYPLSSQLRKESAESSVTLLYEGLPNELTKGGYAPQNLSTYAELLTARDAMQHIKSSFDLPGTPEQIAKTQFVVKFTRSSNLVHVKYKGGSKKEVVEVLRATADRFISEVAKRREKSCADLISHTEPILRKVEQELESKRRAFDQANITTETSSFDESQIVELDRLISSLTEKTNLLKARTRALSEQQRQYNERHTSAVEQLQHEAVQQIRSQITATQKQLSRKSSRYAKQTKVLARLNNVAKKDLDMASFQSNLEQLCGKELTSGVFNTPAFEGLLKGIEKDEERAETLRDDVAVSTAEIAAMEEILGNHTQERKSLEEERSAASVASLGIESAPRQSDLDRLQARVEEAQGRYMGLRHRLAALRELKDAKIREFVVVTPPTLEACEVDSNRKEMFAMSFIGLSSLMSLPLLGFSWLKSQSSSLEGLSKQFGIPLLQDPVQAKRIRNVDGDRRLRRLATRIRQTVGTPGATILFAGGIDCERQGDLLRSISKHLVSRDARVLILDVSRMFSEEDVIGRSTLGENFANFLGQDPEGASNTRPVSTSSLVIGERSDDRLVLSTASTKINGVDYATFPDDFDPNWHGIAHEMLGVVLNRARKSYSMVLLSTPSLKYFEDVQSLATSCDAVVLSFEQRHTLPDGIEPVIGELVQMGVPVTAIGF